MSAPTSLSPELIDSVSQKAPNNLRVLIAAMVEKAKSGHPGGAMGGADFIHVLFSEFLRFDPQDPAWPFRDRFFLDPGHMSPMLYSQLAMFDFFSMEDLENFRQWGSPTPGHPERDLPRGIENTSGPLGQGHTFGIGAAMAERFLAHRFGDWMAHRTFIYISDGGIQEEIAQGAGRTAGYLGLGNVIMFYDANDIQLSSEVSDVMDEDTGKKYEAWGWHVQTIDGNDADAIREALQKGIDETGRPSLIIGRTTMAKGAVQEDGTPYERKVDTHGKPLGKTDASYEATIRTLGGDVEAPFQIWPKVAAFYEEVKAAKAAYVASHKEAQATWEAENPEMAAKLHHFLSGKIEVDYSGITHKENAATRDASAKVLSAFADQVENMVVASADLSDSDKTNAFLDKTTSFKKGDFSGAFFQAGVSELTMAAICTGMALHGGVIPACGTFFVFSDFMKPTLRLAALMEQPVKFIWTHDAFRVGEDGPTHQPIEQEAQVRLLEQLNTHSGNSSFLVLRPADSAETEVSWQMAMENTHSPTGLILSRQAIKDLPASNGTSRSEAAQQARKGAYLVQNDGDPDVVLIANGSEVATLIEGAALLRERNNLKVNVVSAPSEGLFFQQDTAYQAQVLPADVPRFGLTAGLPVTLQRLVGANGTTVGMTHFGYSAPYQVLDEKFGYTGENVYQKVTEMLG
ncbi:MAG: transketolase [Bacteroidota bacterium]